MDGDDPPFATAPRVIGGRYGLSSKELTPSMVKPIFDELAAARPKRHFTVGIYDDVTHLSLPIDRGFRHAAPGRRGAGGVLRARLGRHGRRQQGVGQDHRREHRPVRPGLLRLRLQEVGLGHRLAPALRARADPLDLPHRRRRLRRLPPVRPARQDQGPRVRQARRDLPAQRPVRPGRGLGPPARRRPAADRRQGDRLLGHRRPRGRRRGRAWAAASTPSCSRASSSSPGILPADEAIARIKALRREDLRQARRGGRRAQLRGHRPLAGSASVTCTLGAVTERPADDRRRSPTTRPTSWRGSPSG